ncbi:hypothetical protein EUTSA_v10027232mg, partial [Eutrema salsugineum]
TTHNNTPQNTQTSKLFSRLLSQDYSPMEALKMKLFVAVLVAMIAFSAVQQAAAVEAPAPSPTSDASLSIPALFATVVTLAFGFLF